MSSARRSWGGAGRGDGRLPDGPTYRRHDRRLARARYGDGQRRRGPRTLGSTTPTRRPRGSIEAGGQVLVEPMDVMAAGRMAVFMDPIRRDVLDLAAPVRVPSAPARERSGDAALDELATRDAEPPDVLLACVRLDVATDGGGRPRVLDDPGRGPVSGGLMPMVGDMWPADLPSHWMTYFAVDDADASARAGDRPRRKRDRSADRHPARTVRGRERSPWCGVLDPQAQPGRPGTLIRRARAPITWRRGTRGRGRGAGLIAARSPRGASVRPTSRAPIAPGDHGW